MNAFIRVILCAFSAAAYAMTPAEMEAAQVAAWKGRTSVRYEIEDWYDKSDGQNKHTTLKLITEEMLRQGDTWLSRTEAEHRHDEFGKKYGTSSVSIDDGKFYYATQDEGYRKQTRKYESNAFKGEIPRPEPIWPIAADYNLEVLPNETISGVECFCYKVSSKNRPKAWNKHCVGIKDGVRYFTERTNLEGVVIIRWTVKSVAFNVALAPERFKFTPQPGVEIIDKSKR